MNARGNSNHRTLPPCTNFLFNSPGGKVVGGRGSRGRTLCRCPPAAYLWLAAELHGHGCLAVHQDGHRSADKRRARKGGKRSAVRNTRQQHKSGREQGVGHFSDWDPIDQIENTRTTCIYLLKTAPRSLPLVPKAQEGISTCCLSLLSPPLPLSSLPTQTHKYLLRQL